MPFMDGLELSKILHDNYINTKIILFSGWDDFEYARTAISYGVSQYLMKPIDYDEMQKLLTNIHEELEKEYAEKLNRTRLENIYAESIPLLRQQFFTQLLTEPVTDEYYDSQIKNLKLNLNYTVFHIITVKIRTTDLIDVLSELSIKETIKEALENASAKAEKLLMADNDTHIAEVVAGENKVYVDTGIFPTAERRHMADRVQGNEAEREGKNNFDDHTISAIIKSADMV